MAQETFTASCGCIWHGERHYHPCVKWPADLAKLERLRADPAAAPGALDNAQDVVYDHMPPSMVGVEPS